jgi:hypothetical protein
MCSGWCECISALLIVVPALSAQVQNTAMLRLSQPDAPGILVRTLHGKDYLQSATLKNIGTAPITGYRIGWVEVYPEKMANYGAYQRAMLGGKDKIALGYRVDVPEGIDPMKTTDVPAQGVSDCSYWEGATAVVFFVAEVRTATGTVWKADLDKAEDEARKMAEKTFR